MDNKNTIKKLVLNKETLRTLTDSEMEAVAGGLPAPPLTWICTISCNCWPYMKKAE